MANGKWLLGLGVLALAGCGTQTASLDSGRVDAQARGTGTIGINVALRSDATPALLADLGRYGRVRDIITQIDAVTVQAPASQLAAIRRLPYVEAANPDAERSLGPVSALAADTMADGMNTWNLDAVNVTDASTAGRTTDYDGTGVYVAVLDTGLLKTWRNYFPEERIATEYARSFGGGGGEVGTVSEQPNKWGLDQNSHGTHVTSTILGYNLRGQKVNGVATGVKVIPVKVLNQNGSGWSSVISRGIVYVADLAEELKKPIVINMSLGGSVLDAVEKNAIKYAISKGVVIVASAGNSGPAGMGFPGAYPPVISVAATGWTKAFTESPDGPWYRTLDYPEDEAGLAETTVASFSSRQLDSQELDVAAPGEYVVGPYQTNGQLSYYYLSGTSMAAPHVAGIAALMLEAGVPGGLGLRQATIEAALKESATPFGGPAYVEADYGQGFVTADAAIRALP